VATAEDGRALVVTVSVLPEIVQLPAGMEQVAVSVGLVLKPVSLIWNVKALLLILTATVAMAGARAGR